MKMETPNNAKMNYFGFLGDDVLGLILLFLDKSSHGLTVRLSPVSRSLQLQLKGEGLGRALCISAWGVDELRFTQWPTLTSWWALYRVLQRWAPHEGFYSLANAYPWGLLLLLRFHEVRFELLTR